MDEITRFVILAQTERFGFSDLCEQFGISKTSYKHLARYALVPCAFALDDVQNSLLVAAR